MTHLDNTHHLTLSILLTEVEGKLPAEAAESFKKLRAEITQVIADYAARLGQRGPRTREVTLDELLSEPAGRDLLLRAWQADPRRTENDLIELGARSAASVTGSDYLAHAHRAERSLYAERP